MGRESRGALTLARSERLRQRADIQALFQRGQRDDRRSFVALWLARDGRRRVGFTVSRRAGSAVARNRARRRIREAYRRQQRALPAGIEAVFIARPGALTEPFTQVLEQMGQALAAMAAAMHQRSGPARP